MDADSRIFELKLKGYCCSQIIMQLVLEDLGKENPDLVAAMAGLCNGFNEGKICGALSAGICALYMVNPVETGKSLHQDLQDWFYESFGALDCKDLLCGDPMKKLELCPSLVANTYEMVKELLELE